MSKVKKNCKMSLQIIPLISLFVVTFASEWQTFGRIVGGINTTIEQHPYQVDFDVCGATIIGKKWILTAAHCIRNDERIPNIRVGSTERKKGREYEVKRAIQHPKYVRKPYRYDVALMELKDDLEFGSTVQSITIGSTRSIREGAMAVVTGWGHIEENGTQSALLKEVTVPIVSQIKCKALYKKVPYKSLHSSMFCAGYYKGEMDSCQGDSGSPLVINNKLLGIVSYGEGCARPKFPGVYTRIPHPLVRNWIKKVSGI